MKRTLLIFIVLIGLVLSGTIVNAQSKREQRRAERAERKQAEAEQREKTRKRMLSLVDKQSFVLTANILYDKRQNSYPVSANTNFLAVNGKHATVQIAFPGAIGRNGIGGVTIDGRVTSYEVRKSKKGGINVYAQISSTSLGNATLNLRVLNNGTARAIIRGSFGSAITLAGDLLNPAEASVYKGMPNI